MAIHRVSKTYQIFSSTNKLQSFLLIFERIIGNLSAIQLLDALLHVEISTSLHYLCASDAASKACIVSIVATYVRV